MKKILMFLLVMGLAVNVYAANEWEQDTPLGSSSPSDLDTNIQDYITEPLERLLFNYRKKAEVVYASASTLTVNAGEVACRDSGSTLIKMRRNTSSTTVAWTDIDTGSEAAATTYYVWAVADADATTFTVKISASSTFPTGVTYASLLGSFYNDASSNITDIGNYEDGLGAWLTKSVDTTYQAMGDGFVVVSAICDTSTVLSVVTGYTDSSATPTTARHTLNLNYAGANWDSIRDGNFTMPVKKGDYWKVVKSGSGALTSISIYFIPLQ